MIDDGDVNTDDVQTSVLYDTDSAPIGFTVNDRTYYYLKNIQGDVLCVTDETGAPLANYAYDAWGSFAFTPASQSVSNQDLAFIATYNPVTYRGYLYDPELCWYYLQSRYYDPETGRFLNIDNTCDTRIGITGTNMFAYCCNCPVSFVDSVGKAANFTPTQIIAHLIGVVSAVTVIGEYLPQEQIANFLAYFSSLDVDIFGLFDALMNYIQIVIVDGNGIASRAREVSQAGLEGAVEATIALAGSSVIEFFLITPGATSLTVPIMLGTACVGFVTGAVKELLFSGN